MAYLRQALVNRIRDELRRARRRPPPALLESGHPDNSKSPLEVAIGAEAIERYEAALQRISESDRELVIGRFELEMTYDELAAAVGKPSSNAARMTVSRAVIRLAEELGGPGPLAE